MSEPTTAGEIMLACLGRWHYSQELVLPRCCLAGWEADLLIIRRSGWAEEVEIKVSASDFRAEWRAKADKHAALQGGRLRRVGHKWGSGPPEMEPGISPLEPLIEDRHGFYVRDQPTLIRRFWFAMPRSLAVRLLPDVPPPYGLLSVAGGYTEVLREATNLKPARKVTDAERAHALQSAYYRFWRWTLGEFGPGIEGWLDTPQAEVEALQC